MRFLAILFSFAAMPFIGASQVTLVSGDYPSVLTGVDTLKITKVGSLFPAFATSTPGTWDMTLVSDSIQPLFCHKIPDATYLYSDSSSDFLGAFNYFALNPHDLDATALAKHGKKVYYFSKSLTSLTSDPYDTLFILNQTSLYSNPIQEIAFPATNASSWNSDSYVDIAFELSVAAYFYLHEPGYLRTYTQRNDVVTNWGKMRVRDMSGAPSPYIDVLQVRTTTITTDSAFLSGGPMPGHIQLLLGITQGKRDTVYSQSYYRKGEVTPLAYVEFTDETFSHAIRAKTHVQRLTTSVPETTLQHPLSLYPNPASDVITITDPSSSFRNWNIVDVSGKQVLQGSLSTKNRQQTILLDNIPNGLYWLHVTEVSGLHKVAAFVVSK